MNLFFAPQLDQKGKEDRLVKGYANMVQSSGNDNLKWVKNCKVTSVLSLLCKNCRQEAILNSTKRVADNDRGSQCVINLWRHWDKKRTTQRDVVENPQMNQMFCVPFRLESFDFHRECRRMQWHRLSILIDRVRNDLKEFGWVQLFQMWSFHTCFTYSSLLKYKFWKCQQKKPLSKASNWS